MKILTDFIEKLIDFMSYLKIVASPTLIGAFLGIVVYSSRTDGLGLAIGIIILVVGIIVGILLAEWAKKNGGTTEFYNRINASPDIDDAVREKPKQDQK